MSSNPKARLNGIFQDAASASSAQGNDALRYVAPKEPSRQSQPQQQQAQATAAAAPTASASPSAIVYTATVSLYQYDAAARKYVQVLNPNSTATIGCVIVGNDASYNLLFYNATKQHVCLLPIKFTTFKPILQPKNYVSFYDEKGVNWSVKFASEEQVSEFMKQIFLTKIHVEIWGDEKSVTKTSPNALIKDDLLFVKEDATVVTQGDTVAVSFNCWRVVGNATCAPNEVVTKYAPFEKATDAELRKFRIGEGNERIKALEEGVVGMKKGGKRIILAPPGKTNGQDWYLVEVQVVKTKTGGSSNSQRKSVPNVSTSAPPAADSASNGKPAKTPRRRSSPTGASASASAAASSNNAAGGDIVPYRDESAKDELELKELQLLQREKQLEIQAKALEKARMGSLGMNPGFDAFGGMAQQQQQFAQSAYGSMGFSPYGGGSLFNPQQQQQSPLMSASGRPLDGLIMELHAKVDYLIRNAPAPASSHGVGSSIGGVTDVSAVIRGVERLASENDRLLLQINSQNQQYVSYEKRCEELLKQNQRLQEEKRGLDEKYQSVASQQLNYGSEIASLTSARDAAITQTNRLHAEYQQLLTAFYQKQQVSSESEEQRNELNFERESRIRLERELKKETQTRSLVEQELQLTKKQYEVYMKLKDTELQNQKQELEKQWMAAKSQEQKENDDRLRQVTLDYQQQDARQQEEFHQQLERKDKQTQMQLETVQLQIAQLNAEKQQLSSNLESSNDRLYELERELQIATTASSSLSVAGGVVGEGAAALGLADEEKQIYVQQIELLQEQVKELEEEKFKRVQSDMDSGRLASPSSSPRNSKAKSFGEGESECEHCASMEQERKQVSEKEEAAERALAMAQEIKREAEEILRSQGGGGSSGSNSQEDREKLMNLFKESVNEMFFRFQDYFEEEASLDSKQVLTVIRKVLRQSTKDVIQKLQEPELEEDADDNASDGPPSPPPLDQPAATSVPVVAAAAAVVVAATATATATTSVEHQEEATTDKKDRNARTSSAVSEDAEPISLFMEKVSDRMQQPDHYVSSDEEDDFED